MARIPEETIREILLASPIEDVVGQYLALKPDGRNLKALCPFHHEKTPSFKVHPDKQIYRCYGCGEAGNAIGFVMAMERVDFMDALRTLAERAGITLRREGGLPGSVVEQARRASELACAFYARQMEGTPFGAQVRGYLRSRGFDDAVCALFRLGAAPDAWDNLLGYLRREHIGTDAMREAGLIAERRGGDGFYDLFRGRVMFPIMDARAQVVGFGARAMDGGEPKYLNTPETRFFHKGRLLYGLHLAVEHLRTSRTAMLVEGYTDVIMAVQCGLKGVVACLGTALTTENARELKRHADEVILVYDGDEAGLRAAERAIGPLLGAGVDARVVLLPAGLDPCDVLRTQGREAFEALVTTGRDAVSFLVERARLLEGAQTPAALRRAIERCLQPLAAVEDPIMRQLLRKKIAEAFGVGEAALTGAGPRVRVAARAAEARGTTVFPGPEEMFVAALIAEPALRTALPLPDTFEDPAIGAIARAVVEVGDAPVAALHARFAGDETAVRFDRILARIEEMAPVGEILDWSVVARQSEEEMRRRAFRAEGRQVREQLDQARRLGDAEEVRRLTARYQELLRRTKKGSGAVRADGAHAPV